MQRFNCRSLCQIISIWKAKNGYVRENFQGVCKKFQIPGMHSQFLWGNLLTREHCDEWEANGGWVEVGGVEVEILRK